MEYIFIDHLHSFSSAINNLQLDKMKIFHLIYFDEEYIIEDFLNRHDYFFQKELLISDEIKINLILKNFDDAIKTNCGNKINLNKYSISDKFEYKFTRKDDSVSLNKRYLNITHEPKNEVLFKEIWLLHLINNIKKIDSIIREVLNPLQSIKDNENIQLENPYPEIFKDGRVYQAFLEYTSKHIIDNYMDYSYLKKRLEHEKLIHRHKDNDFMRIMYKDLKLISEKSFEEYRVDKNKLYSLQKSYSTQRENNFNIIFSECLTK